MDPSKELLEIAGHAAPFNTHECVSALQQLVALLQKYLRTITAETIGDVQIPMDYSQDHTHYGTLRGRAKGKSPLTERTPILDARGFFFCHTGPRFLQYDEDPAKALIYGINRDGRWLAVVVTFRKTDGEDGVYLTPICFDVRTTQQLFIPTPSELVSSQRFRDFRLTFEKIRKDIAGISKETVERRERQHKEALELDTAMNGCSALAEHIIAKHGTR